MNRKKPIGRDFDKFAERYDNADVEGKKVLAAEFKTTATVLREWKYQGKTDPIVHKTIIIVPGAPASNVPLKLQTSGMETVAVINDIHHPYQDKASLWLMERILVEVQPQYLVYNGDVCDFYQISKFNKNPERVTGLQKDINSAEDMFDRHKRILPDTKKYLTLGNHEDRWQKFLWTEASALSSLNCLTFEELFHLKDYDIKSIPYECGLMINGVFLVLHGDLASIHSGYTAKRMFEKHGGSGIVGHCHRGGSFYKRDRFGIWGWWENFCLCSLDPDWIRNPNWVHGFSLVHFHSKRFWVEQIPIIGNACMYGGRLYEYGKET